MVIAAAAADLGGCQGTAADEVQQRGHQAARHAGGEAAGDLADRCGAAATDGAGGVGGVGGAEAGFGQLKLDAAGDRLTGVRRGAGQPGMRFLVDNTEVFYAGKDTVEATRGSGVFDHPST
ncbi:hypothetical protein ONA91_34570 [Micromonospora sp. DR5-3]|uniref:hypothetical protein n=1 Tax=unclassified Micromonospora TaxID=2617518 RepID=UPI0011D6E253|nr:MULTISPECIES: hypothetical protein [unclassified Micromonospora]MCW3819576.1 hypothetical protein [Micromonospora sp. DR5-3]TYC19970.1 hypothetical protein FXF52_33850 [Micromonospora sp. MP36]